MKNTIKCDLHVHSNYSYDNHQINTMEKNIIVAIERGIEVLCFTDHIECCHFNTFDNFPFDGRQKEFERLKAKYGKQIKLLLGFEMGSPHHHPKELAFLRSLCPDMIIGSVHFPAYYNKITWRMSPEEYRKLYNEEVRKMVEYGGFDVLGHMDMPKKYQPDYVADKQFLTETLRICVQNGIVPEMNTSSLRKSNVEPVTTETMISAQMAQTYAQLGGKYVTISSDSHHFETVGSSFASTYDSVRDHVALCYFQQGKLVEIQ